jgi:hypothetical protein
MKILATQETDWLNRNPIIHHRMNTTPGRTRSIATESIASTSTPLIVRALP